MVSGPGVLPFAVRHSAAELVDALDQVETRDSVDTLKEKSFASAQCWIILTVATHYESSLLILNPHSRPPNPHCRPTARSEGTTARSEASTEDCGPQLELRSTARTESAVVYNEDRG